MVHIEDVDCIDLAAEVGLTQLSLGNAKTLDSVKQF